MKVLVTGKDGQVARSLVDLNSPDIEIIAIGRPELDITDQVSVEQVLDRIKPDIVVNAAAYTAVDKAEEDVAPAFLVNRDGARHIAQATALRGLPVIHISTDYVFNGQKSEPYNENDAVGPLNVYGLSKLEGEWAIEKYNPNSVILRTAWVYSPYGNNFVKTMLRLAETRDEINVVCDQWGTPTSAGFIAETVIDIAKQILSKTPPENWRGVFHLVPDGVTNWADFANAIFAQAKELGLPYANVNPIAGKDYPTLAKRPDCSQLSTQKLGQIYGIIASDWESLIKMHFQ